MNNTLHLYNRDRVQVAAHRGVAGVNIPCNTIPAFDIALHGGAAILEMDLFKSLDGEIFIFHTGKEPFQLDRHIDLTRMTAEEIRKLRLINVDFNETEHGLNTFDEVLEHMKNRCILNLDRCGAFIPDVIKQVERHGMKEQILLKNPFKLKKELPRLPGYIIVTLWTAFIFCMIGWIILASLSTTKEIFTGSLLASGLHFENYTKALFTNKAALNLLNSVIYTVPSCILIIVVCAPAAYCMSRFKFRGAGLIQALIIIGLAIPNIMIVMPLFSIVSALNLSGTHFTLIFLYTACSVPYTTFFLLTFFKGISTSFEEAAAIDGCGPIQCFWKIMFPLAQPAIVTVSIFNFIGKWNEYFMALIFANKSNLRPIGVGLYQTVTSMMNSGDWAGMFASVVIVFIPTVVIYAFLSDKIISGVTAGGNKG